MDKKTLKALKLSIEKWEKNAIVSDPDQYLTSSADCPLCHLYNKLLRVGDSIGCDDGCPVFEKTGKNYCAETPHERVIEAKDDWAFSLSVFDTDRYKAEAHQAALDEVEFLRSLLPDDGFSKDTVAH